MLPFPRPLGVSMLSMFPLVTAVALEMRRWSSWAHEILLLASSFWSARICLSSGVEASIWSNPV
eukprot:3958553-Pyramimonas_sp.AAC.1